MNTKRFTRYLMFFMLLLSGAIFSCQKDDDVKAAEPVPKFAPDSSTGNYLASKGTLRLVILDSTYNFDAAIDSIAFVNVHTDNGQYFGITAINKAHTMSFGVSSAGYAQGNVVSKLAGSQFLVKNQADSTYSLTQYPNLQDTGKITLTSYKQDSVLATGSFYTYLSRSGKTATPEFYKVKGTFSLKMK